MKRGTDIHHASGHCWKGFQSQRLMSSRITVKKKLKQMSGISLGHTGHCRCKVNYGIETEKLASK